MKSTLSLAGVIPPTATPFTADGDIDLPILRKQIAFMQRSGVHGVCVGGSSGEGHTLDSDELRLLWNTTAEELGGALPLVAGVIINSTRQARERCKIARESGAVALQVTPPYYVFKPSDDALVEHFRVISEDSGLPVIIYNVVPWCYLSPDLLVRIMREVPGVIGVKQSNGDLKLMAELLLRAPADKLIFTAVDALLYPSFALGAHGTIAANPAAVPRHVVALWNAVKRGDHVTGLTLHKQLLNLWDTISCDDLPACIKYVQSLQGVPMSYPRAPMRVPDAQRRARIKAALRDMDLTAVA